MSVNKYGGLGILLKATRIIPHDIGDYCVISGKRYVIMNEGQDKVIFSGTYGQCQSRLNKII